MGADGAMLTDKLKENGIDDSLVLRTAHPTGHAIIQVDVNGQNSIIVYAGANGALSPESVDRVLSSFGNGDLIVLQNEVAQMAYIMTRAHAAGMCIAFNPSPITPELLEYPLHLVDYFVLNEVEGAQLAGVQAETDILPALVQKYPRASFVLTLGKQGAVYRGKDETTAACGILDIPVVDTTAAGDTFCGYFMHEITAGATPKQALLMASLASNIAITRAGAEPSIPHRHEVEELAKTAVFEPAPKL